MAISFPAPLVVPVNTVPAPAFAAGLPFALQVAQPGDLALPTSQPLAADATADAPQAAMDGAAMRPDQVVVSRQLTYPAMSAAALAASWQSMVRTYSMVLEQREQRTRGPRLPSALLATAADSHEPRPSIGQGVVPDAWRFTVHAGARPHTLQVIPGPSREPRRPRRRARPALRLELRLADGKLVVVQIEPLAQGLAVELCAPDAGAADLLRALQPQLALALSLSGLEVLRWELRDRLPGGAIHDSASVDDAAKALTLPVFRAVAEIALLLPSLAGDPD